MNHIAQAISSLLYQYDCVVIPQFGGFITNYTPAHVDHIKETFYPPAKAIMFNKSLNQNDGLLANFIAQKEGIDYEAAQEQVDAFVKEALQILKKREILEFPSVGKLFMDFEQKIQFLPFDNTNFLLNSFGLPSYTVSPINYNNTTTSSPPIETLQPLSSGQPVAYYPVRVDKKSAWWGRIAAAALILLFFIPVGYYVSEYLKYSNPEEATNFDNNNNSERALPFKKRANTHQTSIVPLNSEEITLPPTEEIPVKVKEIVKKETPKPAASKPKKPSPKPKTYNKVIVIGSFGNLRNVNKLKRRIERAGYEADIKKIHDGLRRVGVRVNSSETNLQEHLRIVRETFTSKAWVLK